MRNTLFGAHSISCHSMLRLGRMVSKILVDHSEPDGLVGRHAIMLCWTGMGIEAHDNDIPRRPRRQVVHDRGLDIRGGPHQPATRAGWRECKSSTRASGRIAAIRCADSVTCRTSSSSSARPRTFRPRQDRLTSSPAVSQALCPADFASTLSRSGVWPSRGLPL